MPRDSSSRETIPYLDPMQISIGLWSNGINGSYIKTAVGRLANPSALPLKTRVRVFGLELLRQIG